MVRVALTDVDPVVAVMVAVVAVVTARVFTVNVTDVAPAGTVTVAGTVAFAELEVSLTTSPPAGAAELRVTVPVELDPPVTAVGLSVSEVAIGAFTVTVVVAVVPAPVAVTITLWFVATGVDVTVKYAEKLPAGMVTVAGTVSAALFDCRVIVVAVVTGTPT